MAVLLIKVQDSPKWVKVEDLSGPAVRFEGVIEEGSVAVPIHSGRRSGMAAVYAGRSPGLQTAQFYSEDVEDTCELLLDDRAVPETTRDAGVGGCTWQDPLKLPAEPPQPQQKPPKSDTVEGGHQQAASGTPSARAKK